MKATKNAPHINKSQENTPNWKHSWKLKVISFQFSHSLLLECYFSRRYRFITNAYNCYLYCTQWRVGSWNKLWVSDLRFGHIFVESYLLIWLHGKVRCPQSMARRIHASKSASRQQCSHRRGEAGDLRVNSVNSPLVVSRKGEKGKKLFRFHVYIKTRFPEWRF